MKNTTIAAAAIILVSLSACGSTETATSTSSSNQPAKVATATAAKSETTTESTKTTEPKQTPKSHQSQNTQVKETHNTQTKPANKKTDSKPVSTKPTKPVNRKTPAGKKETKPNSPKTKQSSTQVNYQKLTTNGTFLTPDKSVMCVVYSSGKVMCAANKINYDLPKAPKRCAGQDFGHSISATPNRKAQFDCGSDYVYSSKAKTLPVSKTLVGPRGLTCTTTTSSVACDYHGKSSFIYSDDNFTAN